MMPSTVATRPMKVSMAGSANTVPPIGSIWCGNRMHSAPPTAMSQPRMVIRMRQPPVHRLWAVTMAMPATKASSPDR